MNFEDLNPGDKFICMLPFFFWSDFRGKIPEETWGYIKLDESTREDDNNAVVGNYYKLIRVKPDECVVKLNMP